MFTCYYSAFRNAHLTFYKGHHHKKAIDLTVLWWKQLACVNNIHYKYKSEHATQIRDALWLSESCIFVQTHTNRESVTTTYIADWTNGSMMTDERSRLVIFNGTFHCTYIEQYWRTLHLFLYWACCPKLMNGGLCCMVCFKLHVERV